MPFSESHSSQNISLAEAAHRVLAAEQAAMGMGANDYEYGAFAAIKQGLFDGKISPEEAVRQAESIVNSKQDYH
mgnify:CR=1 FL=1